MYQKEIIYMSLHNDDVKGSCVGYLKSEERQGIFELELQIKNIPKVVTDDYPIRLQSTTGWYESGSIMLKEGNGRWTGNMTEPVVRAEIILSDLMVIKGQSKNAPVSEEREMKKQTAAESGENENELQAEKELGEKELGEKELGEKELGEKKLGEKESGGNELKAQVRAENTPLYENKWEQLLAAYEQIHPYGDNRVYVKLEPKDFVILPSGYQHLVNNSFLLHGFYNYRYLILGKEKDFYLGVPGVFYEREKMVALMFGFEAFECEGGNAKEGKFGYYLRKVEL